MQQPCGPKWWVGIAEDVPLAVVLVRRTYITSITNLACILCVSVLRSTEGRESWESAFHWPLLIVHSSRHLEVLASRKSA